MVSMLLGLLRLVPAFGLRRAGRNSSYRKAKVSVVRASVRGLCAVSLVLLSACSDGGDGGYGGGGNNPPPAAIVTIAVAPTTVPQGKNATLTWSSDAATCTATGAWTGTQAPSGTLTVSSTTLGNNVYLLS
jgi:hypothetical protein